LDRDPEGEEMQLAYAYRKVNEKGESTGFAAGTGALRENWSRPSAVLPGKMIAKWVPSFLLPFE